MEVTRGDVSFVQVMLSTVRALNRMALQKTTTNCQRVTRCGTFASTEERSRPLKRRLRTSTRQGHVSYTPREKRTRRGIECELQHVRGIRHSLHHRIDHILADIRVLI